MSRQIKHLFSLLAVVTASITLAGCFRSTEPAIQKGEQMPWGDRAICTVDNTRYVVDLSKPEKTENGGVVYNTSSDQYVFKRLEDDLYIVQVKGSNGHIYGYLLNHKTKGIQTLGFPREPGAGLRNLARESDVMLSPSKTAEGWTEMDARKPADIEKFLSRVKIGDLQPKGSCKFSSAPAKDSLLAGPLKRNLTRDEALDLSGAYECNLADVCFNLGEGAFPGTLNKGKGTVTAAFSEHGIRKVTISAKGSLSDINKMPMSPMQQLGPDTAPLYFEVNGSELDWTRPDTLTGAPKVKEQITEITENLKKAMSDIDRKVEEPTFKSLRIITSSHYALAHIKAPKNFQYAMAQIQQNRHEYTDIRIARQSPGLYSITMTVFSP